MPQPLDVVLVFSGDSSKATQAVNKLQQQIGRLNNAVNGINKMSSTAARGGVSMFSSWTKVLTLVQGSIQRTVDSFRLMSQGIMSVGRALTFFISIPAGMFLRNAVQTSVDFEEQLVRVQKTTGMAAGELQKMGQALRDIARSAPTSHTELGIMAEQAGQLGITVPERIAEFVRWMEILATSTNISGDEVVGVMGKISAAFGFNVNESVDEVVRLANVMNELENTTAATAGEIADALFRFAPQAKQLRISAADAAALSAALISLGVSSESTGTRLGNMFIKLTQNADKFAELAAGTEKYESRLEVLNALNEDAVDVLFDLITMMEGTDNRAQALAEAFDMVGLRGGRALNTLAGNSDLLSGALERARKEWSTARSLLEEYNLALEASANQMRIFRNNVNDVSIEFGQTLLPAINDLIQFAVPALRMLGKVVRELSREQKLIIAGFAVLTVVLGPLLFLLSQIFFGIFMVGLGMIKLVTAIAFAVKAIIGLGVAFASLGTGAIAAIAIVLGAIVALKTVFREQANKIADFFRDLAAQARTWGENLSREIGSGLIAGAVAFIGKALTFIGNLIASFLEAKSPPDVGPLSHIDRWGQTLFDTYLKGMMKADFSILKRIGSTIGNILKNLALTGLIGESQEFTFLLEARQNLAKLLDLWRETGEVSEEVLNEIVKNLGEAADEIKELIVLNIELIEAEEALAAIREEREEFLELMDDEIRATAISGGTAAERVAALRALFRERSQGLKDLDEEEDKLEEGRDLAKERFELQKALVDAMQDQDDIQARLIKALEKAAGAMEDAFEFPEIDAAGANIGDKLKEALDPIVLELEFKFASKEQVIKAFLAGLQGISLQDISPIELEAMGVRPEDASLFGQLNQKGLELRDTWEDLNTKISNLRTGIDNFFALFEGTGEGGLFSGIVVPQWLIDGWNRLRAAVLTAWFVIKAAVESAVGVIKENLQELSDRLGLSEVDWLSILGGIAAFLAGVVIAILGGLTAIIVGVITFVSGFAAAFIGGVTTALEFGAQVFQFAFSFIQTIIDGFKQMVSGGWKNFWTGLWTMLKGIFGLIIGFIAGALATIIGFIIGFVEGAVEWFMDLWHRLVGGSVIPDMLAEIKETFENILTAIVDWIRNWASDMATNFQNWIADWIETIKGTFQDWIQLGKSLVGALVQGITANAGKIIDKIKDIIREAILKAGQVFGIDLSGLLSGLGLDGGGGGDGEPEENFAAGGIALQRMAAIIGDSGPEAVLPLHRLTPMMAEAMQMAGGGASSVEVNINNPVVRSDRDIKEIAKRVKKVLEDDANAQRRMGVVRTF